MDETQPADPAAPDTALRFFHNRQKYLMNPLTLADSLLYFRCRVSNFAHRLESP